MIYIYRFFVRDIQYTEGYEDGTFNREEIKQSATEILQSLKKEKY